MGLAMGNAGADIDRDGFRLDGLTVDPHEGLISGPGGVENVDPKVMAVMVELAREPGHVISREELLDRVWHTAYVSDDVLSRCIYCLRRHFEVAGGNKACRKKITTLPRRGYRLEGAVVPLGPDVEGTLAAGTTSPVNRRENRSYRLRTALLMVLLAALAAYWWQQQPDQGVASDDSLESPSLAVLPFSDYGDGRRDEFLAHGIADALITLLARSQPQRVIARSSAFAFAADRSDPGNIAEQLGVSHIVEGSLRRNGDQIGVSVQLIDAATAATVWADRWEVPLTAIPRFEHRLASVIAKQLGWDFRAAASVESLPGESGDAYVDHLHARHLMHRRDEGDLDQAIGLFERAVSNLPSLANAWAGLASAAWLRSEVMPGTPEGRARRAELLEKARQAGERALALDPDHAEALLRLSRIALSLRNFDHSRSLYLQARRVAPNDPTLLAMDAGIAFANGDHEASIRLTERALAMDPLAAAWRATRAGFLKRAERFDEATEEARRVIGLSDGILRDQMRALLVEIAIARERLQDAFAQAEVISDPVVQAYAHALLFSASGQTEAAQGAIARLAASNDFFARIYLAEAHAFRGDDKAALEIVKALAESKADEQEPINSVLLLGNINANRNLVRLRDHPDWPESALALPSWIPPPRSATDPDQSN